MPRPIHRRNRVIDLNEKQLLQGNLYTGLIRFALPFMGASLLQFIYGAVDLLVVGRYCDPASIVGVSNGAQIMQILTLMVVGFTTGITVLVGQYLGAGRARDMERAFVTGAAVFAGLAALLFLLLLLGHSALIDLIQTPDEAVPHARRYLMICGLGAPFIVGYNVVCSALRAMGDSCSPMLYVAAACVTNIAGDFLLVGGLKMGVAGAAIATLAAQGLSFALSLTALRRPSFPCSAHPPRPDRATAVQVLRVGVPLGLQSLLTELSFLLITVIINLIGLDQSAGVGIVERILAVGFMGASAFSAAISATAAQNMGAGQPERARRAALFGMACSVGLGAVLYTVFLLFSPRLIGLFTTSQAVIGYGAQYMTIYASDCVLVGIVFCLNGFFNGCGKAGFTMFNGLFSTFAVRVPLSYLISILPGATMLHMGIAAPAASLVQIVLQLLYFRSGRWRKSSLSAARENV